jgi:dihydropyrimidinase
LAVDTLVVGGIVVLPEEGLHDLDIAIADGRIVGLLERGVDVSAKTRIRADGLYVFPGGVDPHVHFGFSMRRESDYYTESCAAISGGVTTVINYDRAKEPYTQTFPAWLAIAEDTFVTDYAFHLGILTEFQLGELDRYVWDFGVTSFKFYMNYRGSEMRLFESDTALDDGFLYRIMRRIAGTGVPVRLCVHCENMEVSRALERELRGRPVDGLVQWERIRPGVVEAEAVNRCLFLARATGASVYLVHLSSRETVEQVALWDLKSLGCFAETCPHYLCLTADAAPALAKVNPPVRFARDADSLWEAVRQGIISTVGSDHVPRTLDLKAKDGGFAGMKSGFPGVGTTLPLLITEGMHRRGLDLSLIARIFSTNAARIFGLYPRKGTLTPGSDADLVLVDLVTERDVSASQQMGSSGWSVYEGRRLVGWPVQTLLRGQVVFQGGQVLKPGGFGQYLPRAGREAGAG